MTTVMTRSPRAQVLFRFGHSLPTLVSPHVVQVPVSGANPERMYAGQTEPPVRMLLRGGWRMDLSESAYDFSFSAQLRGGAQVVDGETATLSFAPAEEADAPSDAMDPVLTYTQTTGFAAVTGVQEGQFRATRVADGAVLFVDKFLMRRYPAV